MVLYPISSIQNNLGLHTWSFVYFHCMAEDWAAAYTEAHNEDWQPPDLIASTIPLSDAPLGITDIDLHGVAAKLYLWEEEDEREVFTFGRSHHSEFKRLRRGLVVLEEDGDEVHAYALGKLEKKACGL